MLKTVNALGLINTESETHYAFHSQIDPSIYPQVHDFYEISLVTSGVLSMNVNGHELFLTEGHFIFLRPGDIHSKRVEEGKAVLISTWHSCPRPWTPFFSISMPRRHWNG